MGKSLEGQHYSYSEQIRSYYAKRDEDPKYLELAIVACEKQIAIAKDVAKKLLAGEKRYTLKSDSEMMSELKAATARDMKIIKDHNAGKLQSAGDYDKIKEVDPVEKYKGVKLPPGFNPNIHKSTDDFVVIPGKLLEHTGYKQLCIIREKQSNWQKVIRLAEQAKAEGWAGDWDKRIEKAKKKLG